ncbi:SDR family oxidoreductase [Paludisphaera borealis]|uniref:NAD(P)H azoreductase n=1 Tax=Paludisphaera borealis TaxID=1387353 RepID=A0A1U7CRH7_9BACT|nr:SDR family oxidoreductase [Paludisphaera borealis]APW61550.1 NAD(P)H azoreductase [Paludisphaera borealis]
MILVTGATGTVGGEVVRRLSAKGEAVRAVVRDPEKAASLALPHVEVVEGDFDRPETMEAAFDGVQRAFLATSSSERTEAQQIAFAEAARKRGVAHVVKLSQLGADAQSEGRFQRYHAVVEEAIQALGLAFTFLRPNLFMQGLLNFTPTIKAKGAFFAAAGDARVSLIDIRDLADVAVAALTASGHEGKIYDLTGPEAITHNEMALGLSAALGRPIAYVDVPPEALRNTLIHVGFPAWQADGLLEEYAMYRRGEAAVVESGVQDVLGRAPRRFEAFAREYAPMFS